MVWASSLRRDQRRGTSFQSQCRVRADVAFVEDRVGRVNPYERASWCLREAIAETINEIPEGCFLPSGCFCRAGPRSKDPPIVA